MNAENELLASAYLDNVLSDEERARAEADREVMAAVERMAEVRQQLSAVERPNPARRDAAIKAALDVFTAERDSAAPPPVTSLAGRRGSRWLMPAAAAALVAIVAGGIVATRGSEGDDDSGGDAAVLEEAAGTTESLTGGQVLTDSPTDPAASPQARDEDGGETTTAAAGTEAGTATTATSPDSSMFSLPTGETSNLSVITSQRQLSRLAETEQVLVRAARCDAGTWLGRYLLRTDGREVVVDVFLAERGGRVRALDPKSCEVLLSARAP